MSDTSITNSSLSPPQSQRVSNEPVQWKKLGFAICIILGIGGLATIGTGLCSYFHVGALTHLSQIDVIILLASGGGGGIVALLLSHCFNVSQKTRLESDKNIKPQNHQTQSLQVPPHNLPKERKGKVECDIRKDLVEKIKSKIDDFPDANYYFWFWAAPRKESTERFEKFVQTYKDSDLATILVVLRFWPVINQIVANPYYGCRSVEFAFQDIFDPMNVENGNEQAMQKVKDMIASFEEERLSD